MNAKKFHSTVASVFAIAFLLLALASPSFANQEVVLHTFLGHGASSPNGSLVFDSAGNLYGTSGIGGNLCLPVCGIVYKLSPTSTGWTYQVIHQFSGPDGSNPDGLIIDSAGNLYGTTSEGGTTTCFGQKYGCGTVFELSPKSDGTWTESTLYRFTGGADGATPLGNITFDAAGNIYGTAFSGGSQACLPPFGCGTVYELSPGANGWTETTLHTFTGPDGWQPYLQVVFDANGNLYGSTSRGGVGCAGDGCGTVFELSPSSSGWNLTTLYQFQGTSDGLAPSNLVFDAKGNLWGLTTEAGAGQGCSYVGGCGTLFYLAPSNGAWQFNLAWTFNALNGAIPMGITFDASGNLWGTTLDGGGISTCQFSGCGTVFELTPTATGWSQTVVHRFGGRTEGAQPGGAVVFDSLGNLYGSTFDGGRKGYGVVFEVLH